MVNARLYLRSVAHRTAVWDWYRGITDRKELAVWEGLGRPCPPPHVIKQQTVKKYAIDFGADTLVETGTYLGDMVHAARGHFKRIVSVELSADLYRRAKRRFRSSPHVEILHGDSGELMKEITGTLSSRCIFWLDGHYSSGITAKGASFTPIGAELKAVFENRMRDDVILIDDARLFDGTDYPTLAWVENLVASERPDYKFSVLNDIIRIHRRIQREAVRPPEF